MDWILMFAKPYIENIPKIALTVFIKCPTKAKWDAVFEDQRKSKVFGEMSFEMSYTEKCQEEERTRLYLQKLLHTPV
jgi:hypothetical protein